VVDLEDFLADFWLLLFLDFLELSSESRLATTLAAFFEVLWDELLEDRLDAFLADLLADLRAVLLADFLLRWLRLTAV